MSQQYKQTNNELAQLAADGKGVVNADVGVSAHTPGMIPFFDIYNQHQSQSALNQQQHQNTMLQMGRSQEYNLQNMALQNQYTIDAENRSKSWNDVGAQIDRGQRAGVSALATLGAGTSQSMGVSSSPSSSTPQPGGASAGQAIGGDSLADLNRMILQDASLKSDLKLKDAQAFNLIQQGNESISRAFGNWIDNSFKPFLNTANLEKTKAEALSAKCKAIVESYWITGKDEEGNPLYQSKIRTELRKAIADAGLTEQEQNTSFAMMWNFITSGYKNISEANKADAEAQDLKDTVDSRVAANEASANESNAKAREANARAVGHELSNRDYELYGIDKNTDFRGVPLLPLVRWFEDLDRAVHNNQTKGLASILGSIVFQLPDKITGDVKAIIDFIKSTWQNTFGTLLPDKDAKELYTLTVPHINSKTGTPGRPHSGVRNGITMSK